MSRWVIFIVLIGAASSTSTCGAVAGDADAIPKDRVPRQTLDDLVEPLDPVVTRSEVDSDRLHAAARYAAARIHVRSRDYALALREYQRAVRYDPRRPDIIYPLLRIARHLERHGEVARYAVVLIQRDPSDSLNMLRALVYLAERGDVDRALTLYESILAKGKLDKTEPAWLELNHVAGDIYMRRKEYAKAATALAIVDTTLRQPKEFGFDEEVVQLIEGDAGPEMYALIANAFLKAHRIDDARRAFAKAHEDDPDEGLRYFDEAQLHAAAGRKEDALKALDAYLKGKHASQGDAPYALLAELLTSDDDPQAILERLTHAEQDNPKNVALAYALAEQLLNADRLEDARQIFERHLEDSPQARAFRGLARIHHKAGRAEAFLKLADPLADRRGSLALLGEPLQSIAADDSFVDKLIPVAQQKLGQDDPTLTLGESLAMAQIASLAKKPELADQFYQAAIDVAGKDRKPGIFEAWGMSALSAEQYERAERIFQRAVDAKVLPANNPIFYFYLAGALAMESKDDAALVAARRAAKDDPDSVEYAERVAWLLARTKRREEAIAAYRAILNRYDDNHDSSIVRATLRDARFSLSHLLTLEEKWDEAEEHLERILDEFPLNHGAGNDLGYLWADRGTHLNRALRMIEAACQDEPDNKAYLDSLGWVLYRLGRNEEALDKLQRAADDEEADGTVLDHLGDVYAALGQDEQAAEAWQRAIDAFRKSEEPEKVTTTQRKIGNLNNDARGTE